MINVDLRLLAGLQKLLPGQDREKGYTRLEVTEGTTCAGLLDMAGVDRGRALVVLIDGRYAEPERPLRQGEVVSVFPPVAGG